jgi:hypothetical protein
MPGTHVILDKDIIPPLHDNPVYTDTPSDCEQVLAVTVPQDPVPQNLKPKDRDKETPSPSTDISVTSQPDIKKQNSTDILLKIKPEYMIDICTRKRNYEFRKYPLPPNTTRIWFYELSPIKALRYVATIGPVHTPGQVKDPTGLGNNEFDAGTKGYSEYKFGYPILGLRIIAQPIPLSVLSKHHHITLPHRFCKVPDSIRFGHIYSWLPEVFETVQESDGAWSPWPVPDNDDWQLTQSPDNSIAQEEYGLNSHSPISPSPIIHSPIIPSPAHVEGNDTATSIHYPLLQEHSDVLEEHHNISTTDKINALLCSRHKVEGTTSMAGQTPDEVFDLTRMHSALEIILQHIEFILLTPEWQTVMEEMPKDTFTYQFLHRWFRLADDKKKLPPYAHGNFYANTHICFLQQAHKVFTYNQTPNELSSAVLELLGLQNFYPATLFHIFQYGNN